ncbi:dipeptide transport system permease protein DppB [Abditibacteriota bacterium]|nr:dipeptide transport system permease protein DppB [Abditibacteriota bacterium]
MLRFILRRLLQMVPLVLGITLISFAVMQLAPGDYLSTLKGNPQIRPETIERLRRDFGLDQPWPIQYVKWLGNALRGDFGYSFDKKVPAFTLIKQRLYYTFLLSFWSTIFAWAIAIPLGIYVARHRNSFADRIANFFAFAGISLPGFFVALLMLLLALVTGWFPIGGATSDNYNSLSLFGKIANTTWHLILPVVVLGTRGVAGLMRQMRGNMLDVLSENYVLAARARGLTERRVIYKHALRNAINPLITLFGYELSGLLAGAALVETVMSWPGLGLLLLDSVRTKDIYVAMGAFVMGAVMLILGNLIADILLALTDPRIKFSD